MYVSYQHEFNSALSQIEAPTINTLIEKNIKLATNNINSIFKIWLQGEFFYKKKMFRKATVNVFESQF